MYGELGSVKGVVDLSPQAALNETQIFLTHLGYRTVRRTNTSLTAERYPPGYVVGQPAPHVTVSALPQPEGGVCIQVRGNDREGVQEQQAQWREWSESLPRRVGGQEDEDEQPGARRSLVPLPPPARIEALDLPAPPQPADYPVPPPPRRESEVVRGMKLTFGSCLVLSVLLGGLLVVGLVGCVALIGSIEDPNKATSGGQPEISSVVVRVSGSRGLPYHGNYGTSSGGGKSVDGKVGGSGQNYQVPVESGTFDFDMVSAVFQKEQPEGTLKVEILVDGRVVKSQETQAQYGVVDVSYSPQVD